MARKRRNNRRKKTSTGRIYAAAITMFMIGVMVFQIFRLHSELKEKDAQAEALQEELDAAEQRQKELDDYENYVGSDQYVEDEARSKLGLTKPDEIIFREE